MSLQNILKRKSEKHGRTNTKGYRTWQSMLARCRNPNMANYQNYGGRGIKVCKKWENSFLAFYHDMGDPPSPKYQIDRIDNDGNYEPGNCRWVLPIQNSSNRRTPVRKLMFGPEKIKEICNLNSCGFSIRTIAKQFGVSRKPITLIVKRYGGTR